MSETGLFGWNEPTWVGVGAIVSAAAALATAWMALLTRLLASKTTVVATETALLAKETRSLATASLEQILQAERHHQDALTPLVFLNVSCKGRRVLQGWEVCYEGTITNAGPGPAVSVEVLAAPASFVARRFLCGMIASSTTQSFSRTILYDSPVNVPDMLPFTAFLLYDDIFGRRGGTFQTCHSGSSEHCSIEQLIRPGVASASKLAEIVSGRGLGNASLA